MNLDGYNRLADLWKNCLFDCKALSGKYCDEANKSKNIAVIENVTKDFCLLDDSIQNSARAFEKVQNELNENDAVDIEKLYKEALAEQTKEFNYKESEIWSEVFSQRGREVEVVTNDANDEVIDETCFEEVNESVMCSNVFKPPVDPISKTVIREPYKNKICGHIYEYQFIVQYIKGMKNKARCPYVGCSNKRFNMNSLRPDAELKEQIEEYLATHTDENEEE